MNETPEEAAGPRLRMSVGSAGRWVRVQLAGQLDLVTAPTLADRVGGLVDQRSEPRIALELAELVFCDSSGLNALVRLWKRAAAAGGELVLVAPPARVTAALRRTGLDRFLRVYAAVPGDGGAGASPGAR